MIFCPIPHLRCLLILLATAYAAQFSEQLHYSRSSLSQQHIEWGLCPTENTPTSTAPILCGSLAVPLDYTTTTNETIALELLRIPASNGPSKGSIFFNFGGPGDSGKEALPALAKTLLGYARIIDLIKTSS